MSKIKKDSLPEEGRLAKVFLDGEDMILSMKVGIVFNEFAKLLKCDKANFFRVRAVKRAAANVLRVPLIDYVKQDRLTALPGIGKELTAKIKEINETGTCQEVEELKSKYPDWDKVVEKKKAKPTTEVKFYWCYDEATTIEMNDYMQSDRIPGITWPETTTYVITPRTAWDEEQRWDDGSDEYEEMINIFYDLGIGELQECVYQLVGNRQQCDEFLESLSDQGFARNDELGSLIEM